MKKRTSLILSTFVVAMSMGGAGCTSKGEESKAIEKPRFEENWDSLRKYEVPEWFKDAKLGIFIHWGPYAVPAYGSEWYPRLMYMDSVVWNPKGEIVSEKPSEIYDHHVENWGELDEFGYKDFIPMFTAENFDAKEWIDLFKKAGAKYIVPVAEHHDGFAMYQSSHTKWDAVEMGPKQDILGELVKEGREQGLKVGASSHFAFNWDYFNKTGDATDQTFSDLYGRSHSPYVPADEQFLELWWKRTKEIIDNYQPDVLWFDFVLDREEYRPYHPKLAAYYYNKGLDWDKEVVLQNKNFDDFESYPPGTNVLDLERGKMSDIHEYPWQTDTSIGANSWGYVSNWISKSPNTLVDDLIDIVSKNGCLLLNIGPKADGTIPEDQKEVLLSIGKWLDQNGEAIYGTTHWKIFGEGPTEVATGHHTEGKNKDLTGKDFRFTQKDGNIYAIAMDWPGDGKAEIEAFSAGSDLLESDIAEVTLLGHDGKLTWEQDSKHLKIDLPDSKPGDFAYVFKINLK
ncbi:alpha-L-fucosidase [Algoriphagus sp. NG3]|uniref:alpha-L-fucosidase n=1 Tax=Algoriphagus sp. NG3 TaxID=3097546 RepID=UPI002A834915|nr:alpha-L-fucosidase [Algoriphagus sp. NG3]WPR73340.1 alpha-L-fucosidase [Algoriphagus sp. NG3]